MDGYNGWTNRDTWAAHLWLTNDEATYHDAQYALTLHLNRQSRGWLLRRLIDRIGNPDDINYDDVNWPEVIEALREE